MTTSSFTRRFLLLLGCGAGLASAAGAQTILYTYDGDQLYDIFGSSCANAGDFNHDGYNDFVVGAPEDYMPFFEGEGYARVFSGLDGSVIATFDGDVITNEFGMSVDGAGDVDNDGWDDIVVGAPFTSNGGSMRGMVRVLSGQTHAILYSRDGSANQDQLGSAVSAAGDVNNDGYADFMAGAPRANSSFGMVRVYSGLNGSVIWQFDGSGSNNRLGASVSDLGDVNGDGFDDLLVGSLFEGVYVFSGQDGAQIHHFSAPSIEVLGRSVSSIEDLNGDGVRDILMGATEEDVFNPGTGYVEVRSGATGAFIMTVPGTTVNHRFGYKVDGIGDWDGDGVADMIVGSYPSTSADGYATIHSGADGSLLTTLTGDNAGDDLGYSVAGLGDINGDGKTDVGLGGPGAQAQGVGTGMARVYSSPFVSCGSKTNYCSTSPNSSSAGATITGIGSTSVADNSFVLLAQGCPGNQFGVFYYGQNQIQVPFGNGFRCVGGPAYRLPVLQTNGSGIASMLLDFTNPPQPPAQITGNSTWNFQFWFRDPAGGGAQYNLTDGLEVTFCP